MLVTDPDPELAAHRALFMTALPRRLAALEQGVLSLKARPESETNRRALRRRLEALHEAALTLDLLAPASAFGEALIAIAGPDVEPDDLELLSDAMGALTALVASAPHAEPEARPREPGAVGTPATEPAAVSSDAEAASEPEALTSDAEAASEPAAVSSDAEAASEPEALGQRETLNHPEFADAVEPVYSPEPPTLELVLDPASGRRFSRGPDPIDVSARGIDGRRILVADDDSSVLWHLSQTIAAAGATVIEARDGLEAWEACLSEAPDLVLCDVMMPKLDGYALCRNLKRDVVLSDVPVILLSWKEDLLQRARELGAAADGYLSKDSDAETVVARAAEALAARTQLEARIAGGGVVHGRLDGITPSYVLRLVARARRDQIVEFCDAGFAYEAHFQSGLLVAARRRGEGGSQQGERILSGLLGMRAGRFILRGGEALPPEFEGPLECVLEPHVSRIRAACRVVRGAELHEVKRLDLDDRVLGPYRSASPPVARDLIDELSRGSDPSSLRQRVSAALLEEVLLDLATRGAIRAARDERGMDLLEGARPIPVDAGLATPLTTTVVAKERTSEGKSSDDPAVVFSERLAQSHRQEQPSSLMDSEPPPAPRPQELARPAKSSLRDRIAELFPSQEERAAVDLSQAVIAGLSLTPGQPVPVSADEPPEARPRPTKPTKEKAAPARAIAPKAAPEEKAALAKPASEKVEEVLDKAAAARALLEFGVGIGTISLRTLASARSAMTKGWYAAKQRATDFGERARAWSPETSATSAAETAEPPPTPLVEPDPDATDPTWLPPVDAEASAPIPIRKKPALPAWAGRVGAPLVLVCVGGYAAYALVGVLAPMGASVPGAAALAPEGPRVAAETAGTSEEGASDKSAAELLLDRAKRGTGSGAADENEKKSLGDSEEGESPELDTQITELPKNVSLAGDKGLLEVNSGDRHKIYVEGVFVGRGPARRVPLAPGKHEVRTRLGGADRAYHVVIEAGKRTRLEPTRTTAGR